MDLGGYQSSQLQRPIFLKERVKSEEKPMPVALGAVCRGTKVSDKGWDVPDVTGLLAPSKISAAPLTRQCWKAGSYNGGPGHKVYVPDGENYAHVHPMFLHSNATSHKWVFGDDGGGMDPEALRRCMSFGFSDKRSNAAIGQYGSGFKNSTMRLGADVVVCSRHEEVGADIWETKVSCGS